MKIQVRNPESLKWISKVEFALAGFLRFTRSCLNPISRIYVALYENELMKKKIKKKRKNKLEHCCYY